jgi:hypothetical protein
MTRLALVSPGRNAWLRLPPSVPDADKQESVRRLIAELGLKIVSDSPVGRVGGYPRGLSGGERKRCNIGVEMVRDPMVGRRSSRLPRYRFSGPKLFVETRALVSFRCDEASMMYWAPPDGHFP